MLAGESLDLYDARLASLLLFDKRRPTASAAVSGNTVAAAEEGPLASTPVFGRNQAGALLCGRGGRSPCVPCASFRQRGEAS